MPTPGHNGSFVIPESFGPGFFNTDLNLFKTFKFTEHKSLQFRVEGFNVLNHANRSFGVFNDLSLNFNNTARVQSNPLFGVWCCVARRSFLGEIVEPDQVTSVEEALRIHTVNAADAMGLSDRGSLEAGNLADFVVLADDPRTVATDLIPDTAVDYVFVGGRPVYIRAGAEPPRGGNLGSAAAR